MQTRNHRSPSTRTTRVLLALLAAVLWLLPGKASAQTWLTLANPHWNITLTDFGYSDFLLDNTPGFEGREYLSGEWGAALGYQLADGTPIAPRFLEPQFLFPDWATLSDFSVVSPLTVTGFNADNLPIAVSVIANSRLQITLRYEMLDTIVGTPMGLTPASATGAVTFATSSRYVLKQTATIKNITASPVLGVQFFQFLHGLSSQRGAYDNRLHAGALSQFQYDVTLAGVDPWSAGTNTSDLGLEDYISFGSTMAPSALEIGHYGIEGNGVDDHALGKPSDGVHRSIEANWLAAPYDARQGRDYFAPPQRWVSGAQRYDLGNLTPNQSVSIEILLSLRTGTRVASGPNSSGSCNGGSSVPGGVDYEFEDVSSDGDLFVDSSQADPAEVAAHIAAGKFGPVTMLTPGGPLQLWDVHFTGTFTGPAHLTLGYDPTILPPGFDENQLGMFQFHNGAWTKLASLVDPVLHKLSLSTTNLGFFALGVEAVTTYTVTATTLPANSGSTTGGGTVVRGASVSLVATPATGYVFGNWTEAAAVVSASPSYTFLAQTNRTLVANFLPVGAAHAVTTSSTPANGGTTSGDAAYAPGSSATVHAVPNAGYKFSKWLVNGAIVSTAADYTFTVTSNTTLVAKFKPVYTLVVTPDPANGGELEADLVYEVNELAKLKAKPSGGWAFVNWTQNGVVVSDDANFQFNVTGNRSLVGHFAPGARIDVSAEPANGGAASGGGVWNLGNLVTVDAVAQPGYVFLHWTEAGDVVSSAASYSFTAGLGRSLTANFAVQPSVQMALAGGSLAVSWPAGATGWVLQECTDLGLGVWANSTRTVSTVGEQKQVVVTPASGQTFFRLTYP